MTHGAVSIGLTALPIGIFCCGLRAFNIAMRVQGGNSKQKEISADINASSSHVPLWSISNALAVILVRSRGIWSCFSASS